MKTRTVSEYMTRTPHTITRERSLRDADVLMRKHGVRHLPVMDGDRLVGLVSLRDIRLVEAMSEVTPDRVAVGWAMWERPFTVAPDAALSTVAREMAHRRIGSTVIVDAGAVVGVFTTVDALEALAEQIDGSKPSGAAPRKRAPARKRGTALSASRRRSRRREGRAHAM